ncbi:MAG: AraC family transcriptional regulator [Treponema sp.]|nr:AraC family transcriptional regulator [Treponema sp.]
MAEKNCAEGEDFRLLGTASHPHSQIARALDWLRSHYRGPFNLAELAGRVNMSTTSLYRHFSRITGMSPLRFQKRLFGEPPYRDGDRRGSRRTALAYPLLVPCVN